MKTMTTRSHTLIFQFLLALMILSPQARLHAQAGAEDTNAPANPAPAQAPDEMTKKITDLVHAGKYAEAQQLTMGLLVAYPKDQRLLKAKTLIEQMLATPPTTPAANNQPASPVTQLTGMDKVDYNALIQLARQAQQNTDLDEQKKLLQQFMKDSDLFLQKHPNEMLLWQLRAASAISLNDIIEGYDAGQKLLSMGAADSNDPAVLAILGQLKNKGWLDKNNVTEFQNKVMEDQKRATQQKFTFQSTRQETRRISRGHLTLNESDAVYEAADGTIRFSLDEIRQVEAWHQVGVKFVMKNGKDFIFEPFFESDIPNEKGRSAAHDFIEKKVSDLLDAVVERWKFVSTGTKWDRILKPPSDSTSFDNSSQHSAPQREATNRTPGTLTPARAVHADSSTIDSASSQPATLAGPTTAILHLYRLSHMGGAFSQYDIEIDGRRVAKIANAQSIREDLPPGKHNINVFYRAVKSDRPLYDLEMEAGKEYWIRVDLADGFIEHMRLAIVPEAEAREESGKLKEITPGGLPDK
jgi:hypothetical protein